MIKEAIKKLRNKEDLSEQETRESFQEIMNGEATQAQIAGFLTGLAIKGETPLEITECARVMREACNTLSIDGDLLEIVGTGGDQVGTFNISTASAILSAAAGVRTAKHGNRSVSSKAGAADVLEALDVKIDIPKDNNEKILDAINLCFMFAPVYHQSMRFAAPVRQELGIPTIFNILGPLANPANANIQLLGVYSDDLLEPMAIALSNLGVEHGMVVHGSDGLDEITLTGPTHAILIDEGELTNIEINPEDYGFDTVELEELLGGDASDNALIIQDIFNGSEGPKTDVVLLNTGVALYISGKVDSINEGITLAKELIESGKAKEKLDEFIKVTNE